MAYPTGDTGSETHRFGIVHTLTTPPSKIRRATLQSANSTEETASYAAERAWKTDIRLELHETMAAEGFSIDLAKTPTLIAQTAIIRREGGRYDKMRDD